MFMSITDTKLRMMFISKSMRKIIAEEAVKYGLFLIDNNKLHIILTNNPRPNEDVLVLYNEQAKCSWHYLREEKNDTTLLDTTEKLLQLMDENDILIRGRFYFNYDRVNKIFSLDEITDIGQKRR